VKVLDLASVKVLEKASAWAFAWEIELVTAWASVREATEMMVTSWASVMELEKESV